MPTIKDLENRYDHNIPEDEKARALNPDADLVKSKQTVAGWQARVDHALAVIDDPAPGVLREDTLADLRHAEDGLGRAEARVRLLEAGPDGRAAVAMAELWQAAQ